jgi:uncharacterized protein
MNKFCSALPVKFKYRARIVLIAGCWLALLTLALALSASKNWREGQRALEKGDYAAALKEFLSLAREGNSIAQFNLGFMYHEGKGVPQDSKEALKWYRLAADQGDPAAQFSLGVMYDNGDGVPQDYKEATKWYRLAADRGTPSAQLNLGFMYDRGNGVPQNYVQAYMWYSLAGTSGSAKGPNNRDLIAPKMTPAQIAEAQRLAREWKPHVK